MKRDAGRGMKIGLQLISLLRVERVYVRTDDTRMKRASRELDERIARAHFSVDFSGPGGWTDGWGTIVGEDVSRETREC